MRSDGRLRRLEVGVGEIRPGRDPELPEHRRRHPRRDRKDARGNRCLREVQALVQFHFPEHDVEAAAQGQPRCQLVGERGLDVNRAQIVLVAREPPVERHRPPGLEPVRCKQPEADAKLGCSPIRDIELWHSDERIVELRVLLEHIVGEATLNVDQRDADRGVRAREPGETRRVEEHRGAIRARRRHPGAGASHRARSLLVDAEALRT